MTIPSYEEMMLPLLTFAGDKKEHTTDESLDYIQKKYRISDEESEILLKSGKQSVVSNRVGWARTYLKKAGLLDSQQRARFSITDAGIKVLKNNPPEITDRFLMQFPSFQEFQKRHKTKKTDTEPVDQINKTPLEMLEDSYIT